MSNAAEISESDEDIFTLVLSDIDYRQLKSFETMLATSVQAAEETLATAKNRYAIYLRMLERMEEENGIDKGYLKSGGRYSCNPTDIPTKKKRA